MSHRTREKTPGAESFDHEGDRRAPSKDAQRRGENVVGSPGQVKSGKATGGTAL
jgi:hypothetical protein